MSVDYMLIRILSGRELEAMNELSPFGSQQEIIDRLCAVLGFERNIWEDEHLRPEREEYLRNQGLLHPDEQRPPWATILYRHHHENDDGRVVSYSLQGDPIECISINRAYPEDFLPVIDILQELNPFLILGPEEPIDPESLFYTFDDWIQKNYEEGWILNYYG